jgi:hypothetical protein
VANVGRQAAQALEHAHHMGIVHRDIKPANLMLDALGHVWVTDFGLAQFQSHAGVTMTGELLGTLRYVSPEQAMAKRGVVDHRADIYSLGATLYELLTSRPIFDGSDRHALLNQIGFAEPIAPRKHDPAIPIELETIILKAVAKNPAERYSTAQEFADDLQRYREDKPILAKRPSLFERARKWSRRHPSLVAGAALMVIGVLVALMVSNWLVSQEQAKTQAALLKGEKARAAEARRAVDLLVAVSEDELADNSQLENVRRRLLETALEYYQGYVDDGGSGAAPPKEIQAGKERIRNILNELAALQAAKMIELAMHADVQKDLNLSAAEREQINRLGQSSTQQLSAFRKEERSLTPEARRQQQYELAKNQQTALAEILKGKLPRLKQIELQAQGPFAFWPRAYAAGVLKLSPEQRQKIREISEDAGAKFRSGREGLSHDDIDLLLQRIQKDEVERYLEVLTPDQRGRWQKMTGAPFEGWIRWR